MRISSEALAQQKLRISSSVKRMLICGDLATPGRAFAVSAPLP